MARAKRIKQHPIDIAGLVSEVRLGEDIASEINEALTETDDNHPPWMDFAAEWGDSDGLGGPAPDDPLTIYFCVPALGSDGAPVTWSISLAEAVEVSLEDMRDDGSFIEGYSRIADAMEALVQRIRAALAEGRAKVQASAD